MSNVHKLNKEQVAQSLKKSGFTPSSKIDKLADPIVPTPMVVTIDQIATYAFNPRTIRNPLFDDIKASIQARGLDQPPQITRRPGEDLYVIRNGGNTRLTVLRELWNETHEERFFRLNCLFVPWESETSALIGHLAENDLHGSLTFIEKAAAIVRLKEMYEQGQGPLTQRALVDKLKIEGYPVSQSLLSRMLDCVEHLLPAIPQTLYAGMGRRSIENLLTFRASLVHVFKKYMPDRDLTAFTAVWQDVLMAFDNPEAFELSRIEDEFLGRMSEVTGQNFAMIELDIEEFNTGKLRSKKTVTGSPFKPQENTESDAQQPPLTTQESENHTGQLELSPNTDPDNMPPLLSPSSGHAETIYGEMTEEERQQRLAAHVVTPVTTTPRVQAMKEQIEAHFGRQLPDFNECAVTAIPVQAGGLANVSDIWYIEARLDDLTNLRGSLHDLAFEIAAWGGNESFLLKTNEGLGFGISGKLNHDTPQAATSVLVLCSLLRFFEGKPNDVAIEAAGDFIAQALVGGTAIQIGLREPIETDYARLPDVLLIKLFRLIRLARHLVDLETSGELK